MRAAKHGVRVAAIHLAVGARHEGTIRDIEKEDILVVGVDAFDVWIGGKRFGRGDLIYMDDDGGAAFGIRFTELGCEESPTVARGK